MYRCEFLKQNYCYSIVLIKHFNNDNVVSLLSIDLRTIESMQHWINIQRLTILWQKGLVILRKKENHLKNRIYLRIEVK